MNVRVRSRFFAAVVATGMAFPVWVTSATDSLNKKVHIGANVTVAGKSIKEGDYDLVVSGTQAKLERGGKVVAEVPCTWKPLENKADHDVVLTNGGAVTEIEFKGNTQAIDF